MIRKYPNLCKPITLGKVTFRNRMFSAPMGGTDIIICALGQCSRLDAVEQLRDTAPVVSVIGDAAKVSTITNAVYWGYHAALDI